jgi:hypothetical protein
MDRKTGVGTFTMENNFENIFLRFYAIKEFVKNGQTVSQLSNGCKLAKNLI